MMEHQFALGFLSGAVSIVGIAAAIAWGVWRLLKE